MLVNYTPLVMMNFGFVMFVLATLMTVIHKAAKSRIAFSEITYRWFSLFPLGVSSLYAFYMHAFHPIYIASLIGWASSPFQYMIALAYLALGLTAVFSFNSRYGFRLAAVFANSIWLLGKASGQLYQLIVSGDVLALASMSSWFWLDVTLPLILGLSLVGIKKSTSTYR